jgi:molecular chaperone GrpE
MKNDSPENDLLKEFESFLKYASPDNLQMAEQPDLKTVLTEISGLKSEVKAESRQFKRGLDSLDSTLTGLQEHNKMLAEQLAETKHRLESEQYELMKTMLLEMLELYDRLSEGLAILKKYQPVKTLFKSSRKKDIRVIHRFKEGQGMTIRRLEQLLWQYKVRPMECVGKQFDPEKMHAVTTAFDPTWDNGKVLEELRKGFLFQDQVLRLAEVKVNKITESTV